MKKIGLIINPVAGVGGSAGLKGSDGEHIVKEALRRGAVPAAESKGCRALEKLLPLRNSFRLITVAGRMGEDAAHKSGFQPEVLPVKISDTTSSDDSVSAAACMDGMGVDLILFAGGDGTARDICSAVGERVPVLGIPAGVKIHSAVFAVSPPAAGEIAASFAVGEIKRTRSAEVMDINEEEYRQERLGARLWGYMKIPDSRRLLQGLKAGSSVAESVVQEGIAEYFIRKKMQNDVAYLIGAGTTCRPLPEKMGHKGSLLGVDLIENGELLGKDLSEKEILQLGAQKKLHLILTPVGGQGFLLGRGNQQISAEVLRMVDKSCITIFATKDKLCNLRGAPLLIDTGNREMNKLMSGYYRVITGFGEESVYKVVEAI